MLLLGGPNTYLPFLQECWRSASRRPGASAATTTRKTSRSRSSSSSRRTRELLRGLRRRGLRPARRRRRRAASPGLDRARASSSATGAARASASRRARRSSSAERDDAPSSTPTAMPAVRAGARFAAGPGRARRHRPRRRLHQQQGRARRRGRRTSSPRPTSSPRATRSRTRRSSSRSFDEQRRRARAPRSSVIGLRRDGLRRRRARGVRARRRQHRRDRRPHDERGALLRRRRRHLRHRRPGHQGPVHEERRHQELPALQQLLRRQRHAAAGDGRSVRRAGHRVRRDRLQGRARAEVLLRLRRVPRHRPRELPEGGLPERGAARRPRAGAAEERLAVRRADPAPGRARAASSCCRAARSTTWPPSRRRSTTSSSACPDAEVYVHPHTGEAGAIGAAMETLRASSAPGTSRFIGLDGRSPSSTRRRTTKRPCVTSARTSASAPSSTRRRPTARRPATSRASPARRAPSRAKRRCSPWSPSARRSRPLTRTWSTTRRARVPALLRARRRCRRRARRSSDVEVKRGLFRSQARDDHAPLPALERRRLAAPQAAARRHAARAEHVLDGALLPHLLRGARHPQAERRLQRRHHRGDVGRGRQVRLASTPASRARWCRRTSTTCSSTSTSRRKAAPRLHLLPDPHPRAELREGHDGQRLVPHRGRARPT